MGLIVTEASIFLSVALSQKRLDYRRTSNRLSAATIFLACPLRTETIRVPGRDVRDM